MHANLLCYLDLSVDLSLYDLVYCTPDLERTKMIAANITQHGGLIVLMVFDECHYVE